MLSLCRLRVSKALRFKKASENLKTVLGNIHLGGNVASKW
jgi:hypothetical protein